jgi:hypothetical protein
MPKQTKIKTVETLDITNVNVKALAGLTVNDLEFKDGGNHTQVGMKSSYVHLRVEFYEDHLQVVRFAENYSCRYTGKWYTDRLELPLDELPVKCPFKNSVLPPWWDELIQFLKGDPNTKVQVHEVKDMKKVETVDLTCALERINRYSQRWQQLNPLYTSFTPSHFQKKNGGKWEDSFTFYIETSGVQRAYRPGEGILNVTRKNSKTLKFPLNAVPLECPFDRPELVEMWKNFINIFRPLEVEEIAEVYAYDA